ncbi:hypothetical protein [Nocardioides humi]|uniref:PKD domain-containing protein n=1 Tax=Nocardioides humi TaxID=449461 RepID=A0ABN1ZT92_9ACTN|nr:hypothetical protein [Nocardioides humi]
MRLLTALALSLSLGLVAAPAGARAAAAPDPQTLAAFDAAVTLSYGTAWQSESGTVTEACTDAEDGDSVMVIDYDVRTGTKRIRTAEESDVPRQVIERGRTRYARTAPAVRKSLRVHRAPVPAKWIKSRAAVAGADPSEELWGDEDGPLISTDQWDELTMSANPGGGATFTGTTTYGMTAYGHYVLSITAVSDAAGRLVRVDARHEQVGAGGAVESVETCALTWTWARPQITIPKKARANKHKVRYQWERKGVARAIRTTWQANERLEAGASEAEVVAWLHTKVAAKQRRALGIKLIQGKAKRGAKPAIAFKITVRDGTASYKPVR